MTAPLTLPGKPSAGWLVLIGGGEFSFGETAEIDRFLLDHMPSGRRRIAFIPTASGSPDYARHLGSYFRQLDPSLEVVNVPVYRARDLRRARNLETIRSAGMVYVGGGVTNLIAETLRGTATEEAMREALESGAVVAGIGAGGASFGSFAIDAHRPGSAVRGFGWIPGAAVETAFDPERGDPLARLMSLTEVTLGLGIPVRTALAIAPDRSGTILGSGQLAVVRKEPHAG
ncbi:MAG TPA: Type 1 glutamine amidotransferase-like domain-containing protein [Thermoanaerobaculia bacterium]|nr:Type 1 glutamine amidotransferase-like domain-containing protein [Thermoanaerobaculia bacterium]